MTTTGLITARLATLAADLDATQEQLSTYSTFTETVAETLAATLADTWHQMPRGVSFSVCGISLHVTHIGDKNRAELTAHYLARKTTNQNPDQDARGAVSWCLSVEREPHKSDHHAPTWWQFAAGSNSTLTDKARTAIEAKLADMVLQPMTAPRHDYHPTFVGNETTAMWRRMMIDDAHEAERARRAAGALQRAQFALKDLVQGIDR
jgi:hypothetical protein